MISNVLFLFIRVESGNMNKGKTPMESHTPSDFRETPMFHPETVWREVSNNDIWRIRMVKVSGIIGKGC